MRSACHFVCLNTSLVIKDTQLLFFLTFGLLWALICFSPSCGLFLSFALTLFLSYSLAFYIENIHISSSIFPLGNMGWETIYHFYFIQMTNLDISTKNSYSILYVLWHGESLNWRQESLLFPSLLKEGTRICVKKALESVSWNWVHDDFSTCLGLWQVNLFFCLLKKNLLMFIILDKCPWMLHLLLGAFLVMK